MKVIKDKVICAKVTNYLKSEWNDILAIWNDLQKVMNMI